MLAPSPNDDIDCEFVIFNFLVCVTCNFLTEKRRYVYVFQFLFVRAV